MVYPPLFNHKKPNKGGIKILNEIIDLIHLAQRGDKQAEAELVKCYEPLINKY